MKLELNTEDVFEGPFGEMLDDAPYLLIKQAFHYVNLWRIAEGREEHDEGSLDGFFNNFQDLLAVWIKDHDPLLEDGTVLVRWNQ